MTTSSPNAEQFSGLILLTGEDKPGLAHSLFEALSPFSVAVIDIDQIIIKDRLILTVQISLNQAHQNAIEEDLNSLAQTLEVDIAAVFSMSAIPAQKPKCVTLTMKSAKLHPKHLAVVTDSLLTAGANIEDITRAAGESFALNIKVSGISETQLNDVIAKTESGTEFSLINGQ
jgi:phosphoserine phosphatase